MSELESAARRRWLEIIERQRASDLSIAAFCRRHGVAASSFFAWKRKLRASPPTPGFVEARLVQAPMAAREASLIEVRLRGGRRVRVGRGFDRELLAEVVAALEATS